MTNKEAYESGKRFRIEHYGFQGVKCSPSFAETAQDCRTIKRTTRNLGMSSTVFKLNQRWRIDDVLDVVNV